MPQVKRQSRRVERSNVDKNNVAGNLELEKPRPKGRRVGNNGDTPASSSNTTIDNQKDTPNRHGGVHPALGGGSEPNGLKKTKQERSLQLKSSSEQFLRGCQHQIDHILHV